MWDFEYLTQKPIIYSTRGLPVLGRFFRIQFVQRISSKTGTWRLEIFVCKFSVRVELPHIANRLIKSLTDFGLTSYTLTGSLYL
jgi:hypothetical protein